LDVKKQQVAAVVQNNQTMLMGRKRRSRYAGLGNTGIRSKEYIASTKKRNLSKHER
jgi:hypothetical protein